MKEELCRICGCKIDGFKKCLKCDLIIKTICNCCQKIGIIQTHIHWIMACKDNCIQYKATLHYHLSRYASGQKRCKVCNIFTQWEW